MIIRILLMLMILPLVQSCGTTYYNLHIKPKEKYSYSAISNDLNTCFKELHFINYLETKDAMYYQDLIYRANEIKDIWIGYLLTISVNGENELIYLKLMPRPTFGNLAKSAAIKLKNCLDGRGKNYTIDIESKYLAFDFR